VNQLIKSLEKESEKESRFQQVWKSEIESWDFNRFQRARKRVRILTSFREWKKEGWGGVNGKWCEWEGYIDKVCWM
jgi:hypothetical protein